MRVDELTSELSSSQVEVTRLEVVEAEMVALSEAAERSMTLPGAPITTFAAPFQLFTETSVISLWVC